MIDKLKPGVTVQPKAKKIDLNIVDRKGQNLAGPPRSGGMNPATKPGKQSFDKVRHITGSGRNR